MTDQAERLFDVSPYGGLETAAERRRRMAGGLEPPVVEPRTSEWVLLRNRQGVMPYFHRIESTAPSGASAAICGKIGTQLFDGGVTTMIRCPGCI